MRSLALAGTPVTTVTAAWSAVSVS